MYKNVKVITLVVAVLALITCIGVTFRSGNAQAAPDLEPGVLLPGDAVNGNAAGAQNEAQIAAGANSYLVVWEDSRTNFAGVIPGQGVNGGEPSGQTLIDIYAARL